MASLSKFGSVFRGGYALCVSFSRLLWLHSLHVVLSMTLATLTQRGSVLDFGYALGDWFNQNAWLRSHVLVHSSESASLIGGSVGSISVSDRPGFAIGHNGGAMKCR